MTQRGDGFARIKGVATFVKNVTPGWKGNVKVTRVGPSYVVAEPVSEGSQSSGSSMDSSSEESEEGL